MKIHESNGFLLIMILALMVLYVTIIIMFPMLVDSFFLSFGFVLLNILTVYQFVRNTKGNKLEIQEIPYEQRKKIWHLYEVSPKIFLLKFNNYYDTAMHFLRLQEFYESPAFFRKKFTIIDFIEWYSKNQKGPADFTYAADWSGFNVPGWVFKELLFEDPVKDWNKYDEEMKQLCCYIQENIIKKDINLPWDFYIIGTTQDSDEDVIEHEIAHGLYSTVPEYRSQMEEMRNEIDCMQIYKIFVNWLLKQGYASAVHADEFQAYLSTSSMKEIKKMLKEAGDVPSREFKNYTQVAKKHQELFNAWRITTTRQNPVRILSSGFNKGNGNV